MYGLKVLKVLRSHLREGRRLGLTVGLRVGRWVGGLVVVGAMVGMVVGLSSNGKDSSLAQSKKGENDPKAGTPSAILRYSIRV